MNHERYFVTGIGTDVGKTVVSAIMVLALKADYWKPVQSGASSGEDASIIRSLAPFCGTIHPSAYSLREPLSPHAAAALEGVEIEPSKLVMPHTDNHLVVEGAGGLMVPLNMECLVVDLIQRLRCKVIVVSRTYLGSINHTLLTIEALRARNIPIHSVVFNGEVNDATEKAILSFGKIDRYLRIPSLDVVSDVTILPLAEQMTKHLFS